MKSAQDSVPNGTMPVYLFKGPIDKNPGQRKSTTVAEESKGQVLTGLPPKIRRQ